MARFEEAITGVLRHEGLYSDRPEDPGGPTNYGISLRWLETLPLAEADMNHDHIINGQDIKALSLSAAASLYRTRFWDPPGYAMISNQRIANKLLDLAVNAGHTQAHRLVQRALRACGKPVAEDGVLGQVTAGAIEVVNSQALLVGLRCEAAGFYRALAASRPKMQIFLNGWLRRAYE